MTLHEEYEKRCATESDINQHMPTLAALAADCTRIAEFGVRTGNSTIALLRGLAGRGGGVLWSYDIDPPRITPPPWPGVEWFFTNADTGNLLGIPAVEMLFIDTWHSHAQVRKELAHAPQVTRYLAFHDTTLFAWKDEGTATPGGINRAIFEFLVSAEGQRWQVKSHNPHNNGLIVLQRR